MEVLHWISFGYADPPEDESSIAAWKEAEEKLVSALRGLPGADRGLIAIGLKFGRGDPQEIPQEFWVLPTESEKEGLLPPPARSLAFRPLGNCVDVVCDGCPESVWQELRFYRRDVMRLWPSPLRSAAASHEAAAPTNSLQDMDPFGRRHWNQLQALLWLCTRSQQAVRVAMASDSDDDIGRIGEVILIHGFALPLPGTSDPFAAAEILIDALSEGRIRAWGVGNGEGDHKEIPASHWNGLRFYWAKPGVGLVQDLPPALRCSPRYAGPRDRDRPGATYWTDVHLSRADMLAIWPPRGADDQEGVMQARYWTLWQTLVWVCTRSRSDVQDASHQAPSPFWLSCAPALEQVLHGRCSEYLDDKEVEGAVVAAIRSGDLPALARRNGDGDRVEIPAEERFGLVLSYKGRSVILRHAQGHGAPFWSDVVSEREAVLANWPDPASPESVAKITAPQAEITSWFVQDYVPAQQNAGKIPRCSDAEAAAAARFGPGNRDHVRAAWRQFAPPLWRRKGPKGLNRKGAVEPSSKGGRRILATTRVSRR